MTQRKEVFHRASLAGSRGDNGGNGRRTAGGPRALHARALPELARSPAPSPPLPSFHQVSSRPWGPRLTPPRSCQLRSVPVRGVPSPLNGILAFRILSKVALSSQSSRLPTGTITSKLLLCALQSSSTENEWHREANTLRSGKSVPAFPLVPTRLGMSAWVLQCTPPPRSLS